MNTKKINSRQLVAPRQIKYKIRQETTKKIRVIQVFFGYGYFSVKSKCLLGLSTNKMVVPCKVKKENY